jgi:RHS repeat-associated protein
MSFVYNDMDIRTDKTVNGVTTHYYLNGSQIFAESDGYYTIIYVYDDDGSPIGMMYHNTDYATYDTFDIYFYEKNLQGDIVAVYTHAGVKVASYTYDAWGNFTATYHNGGENTSVVYNPYTYRGYYFDRDLGMYYLNSRYYDQTVRRFINADEYSFLGSSGTIPCFNLYAYCENNPVNIQYTR